MDSPGFDTQEEGHAPADNPSATMERIHLETRTSFAHHASQQLTASIGVNLISFWTRKKRGYTEKHNESVRTYSTYGSLPVQNRAETTRTTIRSLLNTRSLRMMRRDPRWRSSRASMTTRCCRGHRWSVAKRSAGHGPFHCSPQQRPWLSLKSFKASRDKRPAVFLYIPLEKTLDQWSSGLAVTHAASRHVILHVHLTET